VSEEKQSRVIAFCVPFAASGSWQTSHGSCRPHDDLSVRQQHTNASASMIPFQTAKAKIPSHAIATLSDTSSGLLRLLQGSANRQTLCPVYSRASCSWTRNDVARNGRLPVVSKPYKQCSIRFTRPFSTSTTRRLKLEDGANSSKTSRDDVEVGRPPITRVNRFTLCFPGRSSLRSPVISSHAGSFLLSLVFFQEPYHVFDFSYRCFGMSEVLDTNLSTHYLRSYDHFIITGFVNANLV
jgi:hypothetical protein